MSADVFISHSSKDRKMAETICKALEQRGIACWIASRDVGPGESFGTSIFRAIRAAKVMVLVFSNNANLAPHEIAKELVLAGQNKLVVIPARVEDVLPSEDLGYELAARHWIDLFEDWERAIERLAAQISRVAATESAATRDEEEARGSPGSPLPPEAEAERQAQDQRGISEQAASARADHQRPTIRDAAPSTPANPFVSPPHETANGGEARRADIGASADTLRRTGLLLIVQGVLQAAAVIIVVVASIVVTRQDLAPALLLFALASVPIWIGPSVRRAKPWIKPFAIALCLLNLLVDLSALIGFAAWLIVAIGTGAFWERATFAVGLVLACAATGFVIFLIALRDMGRWHPIYAGEARSAVQRFLRHSGAGFLVAVVVLLLLLFVFSLVGFI